MSELWRHFNEQRIPVRDEWLRQLVPDVLQAHRLYLASPMVDTSQPYLRELVQSGPLLGVPSQTRHQSSAKVLVLEVLGRLDVSKSLFKQLEDREEEELARRKKIAAPEDEDEESAETQKNRRTERPNRNGKCMAKIVLSDGRDKIIGVSKVPIELPKIGAKVRISDYTLWSNGIVAFDSLEVLGGGIFDKDEKKKLADLLKKATC